MQSDMHWVTTAGSEAKDGAAKQHQWRWEIRTEDGTVKQLELIHGDLCEQQAGCDVVVCSAFQRNYRPSRSSMIGALQRLKAIDVAALSENPELDFRNVGCWLSRETGTDYRRVACVELIRESDLLTNSDQSVNTIMKKAFSTLRFILEMAEMSGIPVETIATPLLGAGNQKIDISYIAAPLVAQFRAVLNTNAGVKRIVVYERSLERAEALADVINASLTETKGMPCVFISYSSKQEAEAKKIWETLTRNRIACWMAPASIPEGTSYQQIIPVALQQAEVILLLLTPDAERSRWVQKEVGSAIGANKKLLPYQLAEFTLSDSFRFLLDGEQIMHHHCADVPVVQNGSQDGAYGRLVARLKELLQRNPAGCG